MVDDIIKQFDKSVLSWWLIIGIGAAKTVENTLELVASEWVHVHVLGLDVSVIALYFGLLLFGTTGLIAWKTL